MDVAIFRFFLSKTQKNVTFCHKINTEGTIDHIDTRKARQRVLSTPENQNKHKDWRYLCYWYAPRGAIGVERSGRNPRIWFHWSQMRPSHFGAARSKKPLKKCRNLSKVLDFQWFLGFSSSKTSWWYLKPKKSNSLDYPGSTDPTGHPGGVSIAKWNKKWLDLPYC